LKYPIIHKPESDTINNPPDTIVIKKQ